MSNFLPFDGISDGSLQNQPLLYAGDEDPTAVHKNDDEAAAIRNKMRRMPLWGVILNVAFFMAIPYSVPATVAKAGWSCSILALLYFTFSTYETGVLIGEISVEYPDLSTYPAIAGEAFAKMATTIQNHVYVNLSENDFRQIGTVFVLILQYSTYYLISLVGIVLLAQLFGQLFEHSGICQSDWLIIVFAASVPISQIPTFNEASWMAIFIAFGTLTNVIVFFYEIFTYHPWTCNPKYGAPTVTEFFNAMSNFVNLFAGHGIFPETIREMADKSRWGEVLSWTYGLVIPMYGLFGFFGYYSYGKFANPQLNFNFRKNPMNLLSITTTCIQQLVFMFPSNAVMFLGIELWLGVDPTAFWKGRKFGMPPVIFRLVWRTLLLGSQTLLAVLLIGGDGTNIFLVQALTGAIGMTGFNIFLPYLFYDTLLGDRVDPVRKFWHFTSATIGVAIMFAGVYFSVKDLIEYNEGRDSRCNLILTYSPESPIDPCYES